jgi:NH3-dependent NAD+ synthetase
MAENTEKKEVKTKKATTTKAAAKPKTTAAKKETTTSKKAAVAKKPAAKKTTPRKAKTATGNLEERYRMIEVAAYYIAEKDGFAGNPVDYWIAAELKISK